MTTLCDARGDVVVMTFIYTTCWDLCPAEAATMMQAVKQVGDGVTAYAISVDPVGDTPKRVDDWLRVRHWQNGPMRYLTGTREELAPVWQAYGIVPVNASDRRRPTRRPRRPTASAPRRPPRGSTSPRARTATRSARRPRRRRSRRTPT